MQNSDSTTKERETMMRKLIPAVFLVISIAKPILSCAGQKASDMDAAVENLMRVSGLMVSMDKFPSQIASQFFSGISTSVSEATKRELDRGYSEAYPDGSITAAVAKMLEVGLDDSRLRYLTRMLSSPLAIKMTALALKEPTPKEIDSFTATLASKPPSKDRMALLKEILDESHAVEAYSKIAAVTTESLALATSSGCKDDIKRIRSELQQTRPILTQSILANMMMGMAFTYRSVTNDELRDYLALVRDPAFKTLHTKLAKVIVSEYLSRWKIFERTLIRLGTDLSGETMFAKSCRSAVTEANQVVKSISAQKTAEVKSRRVSSSGMDARHCLSRTAETEVAACAENYR